MNKPPCKGSDNTMDDATTLLHDHEGDKGGKHSPDGDSNTLNLPNYRVIRELGKGGMGRVFLARQIEPVEREVAVKLILNRIRSAHNEQRFEVERQALAQMRHPAIAQIFDAGTNTDGFPYFAMEYVPGMSMVRYCNQHRLSLVQRLELFIRICHGVSHAHQKGIIHRDLKPANILVSEVDEIPQPKIIDFGIATAEASSLERRSDSSVGTPMYMAPELFEDRVSVDTRSDIYSLGVILYELLTGQRPYDPELFTATDTTIIRKNLATHSPYDPSQLIDTKDPGAGRIAADRQTTPPGLKRHLTGDLDAIARKAIHPDRNQRYASAPELAEDIRRHLAREPVLAMGTSRTYRLHRFLVRHAWAVAGSSLILISLVAGLAAAVVAMNEARHQQQIAESRQLDLERMLAFQQSMLGDIDPGLLGQGFVERLRGQYERSFDDHADPDIMRAGIAAFDIAVSRISPTDLAQDLIDEFLLQRAVENIEREFAEQPLMQADLHETVRDVYASAGMVKPGKSVARRVIDLRLKHQGADTLPTLKARHEYYLLLVKSGQFESAREELEEILARIDPNAPSARELNHSAWDSLANLLVDIGEREQALTQAERNLVQVEHELGRHHERTVRAINTLGYVHARSGRIDTALEYFQESLDRARGHFEETDSTYYSALLNVGAAYGALGRFEEALEIEREVYAILSRHFGHRNPSTLRVMSNMAMTLMDLSRYDEALSLTREILQLSREAHGQHNPVALQVQMNLGELLLHTGQPEQARQAFAEALEWRERLLGEDHLDTLNAYQMLALAHRTLGETDQALELLQHVYERRSALLEPDHSGIRRAMREIANVHREAGDHRQEAIWMDRLVARLIEHDALDGTAPMNDALRLIELRAELGDTEQLDGLVSRIRSILAQTDQDLADFEAELDDTLDRIEY
jgi:eukaryotic-like serine/threonine-protein kinase